MHHTLFKMEETTLNMEETTLKMWETSSAGTLSSPGPGCRSTSDDWWSNSRGVSVWNWDLTGCRSGTKN